jgi:hypothetical protein
MVITFESRKKSYPAYVFVFTYALSALLFKDRWEYLIGLILALVLFLGSYGLGKRLSFLIFKTADQSLYLPIGLGCVLVLTYFAGSFSTSRTFFYAIWGILTLLSAFELPVLGYRINRNYFWAAPLILLAVWSSFTPSMHSTTLEYYLGLAHQYLAIGKVLNIPHNLYSSLPPFGPSLVLLFSSLGFDSGVKAFGLLIYFQIVSMLVSLLRWLITEPVFTSGNGRDQEYQTDLMYMTRMELLVIPMLLFPGLFAAFHEQSFDLVAALFFCAAVASLIKECEVMTILKIWNIGLLLAFALWTKYSVLVYLPWVLLFWFALAKWSFSRENWKIAGLIAATTLLFWLAVPIRNVIQSGDPFYPALAGIFPAGKWSVAQSILLENEIMRQGGGLLDALSVLLTMVFDPQGIGLVLLISIAIYPFSRKIRIVSYLLFFGLACYITWFFIYQDFRHFLPVYLLLFPVAYFAFRHMYIRSPKYLWAVWSLCAITTGIPLMKYFSESRLILPQESQKEFLRSHVDYYSIAEKLNQKQTSGEILLLGETRIAYYKQPVIAGSRYDANALLDEIRRSVSPEDLYARCRRRGIRYIVYNENEFLTMYGPQGVFTLTQMQISQLQQLLRKYSHLRAQNGGVQLYELSDTQIW